MKDRAGFFVILPLVAVLSVVADQVTKYLVRANLRPGHSIVLNPWLEPFLRITYVTNSGAAFGLFPNWSHVLIVVAIIVIVALVWYYIQVSDREWWVQVALGLQLGGAIGNLIDRLRFAGSVVDFIDLNFWPLRRWPVFNIADASIVTGVTVLMLLMTWREWQEEQNTGPVAAAADD